MSVDYNPNYDEAGEDLFYLQKVLLSRHCVGVYTDYILCMGKFL